MKKYILDENSKLIDKIEDGDRLRILREKTANFLGKTFFWKIDFVKINYAELMLLSDMLTNSERLFLFAVLPYIGYSDNCIRYINGRQLRFSDFREIIEFKKSKIYGILSSLSGKVVIVKYNKKYFMNPWIATRGSRINKNLKNLFGEYFVLTKGKKWSEIKDE